MITLDENGLYQLKKKSGFGHTFEWYVAMVCEKKLATLAYWGVKLKDIEGEFDVILIRENQIGYIECKSGHLNNINSDHIDSFLKRERILAPQFSVYLVDGISREKLKVLVDYAMQHKQDRSIYSGL